MTTEADGAGGASETSEAKNRPDDRSDVALTALLRRVEAAVDASMSFSRARASGPPESAELGFDGREGAGWFMRIRGRERRDRRNGLQAPGSFQIGELRGRGRTPAEAAESLLSGLRSFVGIPR